MKALIIKYKSVIKFILTFLFVYIGLTLLYSLYLKASDGTLYPPDFLTNKVAHQTEYLLNKVGYNTQVVKNPDSPSMKLIVEGKYLARIVEGCNAISVIILFISFVIAFSGKLKTTIIFLVSGSVIIYIVNLFRIVILSIGLYHYPWRNVILHSIIFPAIIYGMVFLLWMLWVNRFSNMSRNNG